MFPTILSEEEKANSSKKESMHKEQKTEVILEALATLSTPGSTWVTKKKIIAALPKERGFGNVTVGTRLNELSEKGRIVIRNTEGNEFLYALPGNIKDSADD